MAIYKAYLIQEDQGCDYTIGCGLKIIDLKSTEKESAVAELVKIIKEDYSHQESKLHSAYVFELSESYPIDVSKIYKELKDEDDIKYLERLEEEQKKQYEFLKKKFESQ